MNASMGVYGCVYGLFQARKTKTKTKTKNGRGVPKDTIIVACFPPVP